MKKKIFLILISIVVISVPTFLPINSICPSPANYVNNGDFETGSFDPWQQYGSTVYNDSGNFVARHGFSTDNSWIGQDVPVSTKNLIFSFSFKPLVFSNDPDPSSIGVYLKFYKDGNKVGNNLLLTINPGDFQLGLWQTVNAYVPYWYKSVYGSSLPDIDKILVNATYSGGVANTIYFDDFMLVPVQSSAQESEPQEKVWERDHEMQCFQVWINEDNNFEFVFWWAYENNNWVQIFDIEGNLVWQTDFEKEKPQFEVHLPDGMYNVKTFHEAGHILQEFIIGKP
jgi:hypothetical protein